jgi:hypothetical protein
MAVNTSDFFSYHMLCVANKALQEGVNPFKSSSKIVSCSLADGKSSSTLFA